MSETQKFSADEIAKTFGVRPEDIAEPNIITAARQVEKEREDYLIARFKQFLRKVSGD